MIEKARSSRLYPALASVWHVLVPKSIRDWLWTRYSRPDEYQLIRFGGRTFARGRDRTSLYDQIFPTPPVGKSILDVGSNLGYYSIRALTEGASRCTAIEREGRCVKRIQDVAKKLGLKNLQVLQADIFDVSLDEDYDIALCLNVIHHFSTMERVETVLGRLHKHTHQAIILSVASPAVGDERLYFIDDSPNAIGIPLIYISPRYFVDKYGSDHVEVMENNQYPGRWVIIIRKTCPTG